MRRKGASSKRPAICVFKTDSCHVQVSNHFFCFPTHRQMPVYFLQDKFLFQYKFLLVLNFLTDDFLWFLHQIKAASATTFEGGEANLCRDGHWNLWATPYRCTSLQIWEGSSTCKGRQLWWLEWVGISGFFDTKTWTRNKVEIFPEIERMSEVSWCIRSLRSLIDWDWLGIHVEVRLLFRCSFTSNLAFRPIAKLVKSPWQQPLR